MRICSKIIINFKIFNSNSNNNQAIIYSCKMKILKMKIKYLSRNQWLNSKISKFKANNKINNSNKFSNNLPKNFNFNNKTNKITKINFYFNNNN